MAQTEVTSCATLRQVNPLHHNRINLKQINGQATGKLTAPVEDYKRAGQEVCVLQKNAAASLGKLLVVQFAAVAHQFHCYISLLAEK